MVPRKHPDVVVIGAGLVGCLAARALGHEGLSVLVIERRSQPGTGASAAAAGMLAPQMEHVDGLLADGEEAAKAMMALCLAARERFPAIVETLTAETGEEIGYRSAGTFVTGLDETRAAELETSARQQAAAGLRAEYLSADEARVLEPALSPDIRGVLWLPDDHQVDNVELTTAAWKAAEAVAGVEFEFGASVAAIESSRGRVEGVGVCGSAAGERHVSTPVVVIACGAWSGGLAGLPAPLPVRPVKGQMVAVDGSSLNLRYTIGGAEAYTVPRADGRVLIGATVEHTGFEVEVEPEVIASLVAAAARYVPALAAAPRLEAWAGVRPGTPDTLPILGTEPRLQGVVYATGHYRNGILLAPITAEIVVRSVFGGSFPVDLQSFLATRPEIAHRAPGDGASGS